MIRKLTLFYIIFFISYFSSQAQYEKYVNLNPPPSWIREFKLNLDSLSNIHFEGEVTYFLVDKQENKIQQENYNHFIQKLNTESGVQNNSEIWISIDPSFNELDLHYINIYREGKLINKLKKEEVNIVRNEQQAGSFLYNGTISAYVILNDIRKGDVLDYAYTITGDNPLFSDIHYYYTRLNYSQYVHKLYKSFLFKNNLKYKEQLKNDAPKPTQLIKNNLNTISWEIDSLKPYLLDEDIPAWCNPFQSYELTSFKNWQEVKRWSKNMYSLKEPVCIELKNKIEEFGRIKSKEEQIISAIQFVQNEIRYLGMEDGINSHKPHSYNQVIQQKFGDCKDKSYLLHLLLNQIGVKSWITYANTNKIISYDDHLPSPFAFNHVVVKLEYNDEIYWIDPTFKPQYGGLKDFYFPDYGLVLVLDSKNTELEPSKSGFLKNIDILESYYLKDSISNAEYVVKTISYGNEANYNRNYFKNTPQNEIKENYLNYYSNYYPKISFQDKPFHIENDDKKNIFIVTEYYEIPDFFETKENDPEKYFSIYATNLKPEIVISNDLSRKLPMTIKHPVKVQGEVEVVLPKRKTFNLPNSKDSVVNDNLEFTYSEKISENKIKISYSYRSKRDFVPANEIEKYSEDRDKINNLTYNYFYWGVGNKQFKFNWWILILGCVVVALVTLLLKKLYLYNGSSQRTPYPAKAFGGWLILPIIGLYITLIFPIISIVENSFFNQQLISGVYNNINFKHKDLWLFTFIMEYIGSIVFFLFNIFLLIILHKKRSTFPNLYIIFRITFFFYVIADQILLSYFNEISSDNYKELAREFLNLCIWAPYFVVSKRVKRTFVNVIE